jgi:hypothetical protein
MICLFETKSIMESTPSSSVFDKEYPDDALSPPDLSLVFLSFHTSHRLVLTDLRIRS